MSLIETKEKSLPDPSIPSPKSPNTLDWTSIKSLSQGSNQSSIPLGVKILIGIRYRMGECFYVLHYHERNRLVGPD